MKFEVILLVVMIVITIIYLVFAIWHTFISKKQVVMSMIDAIYCIILGCALAMLECSIIIYAIVILVASIWLLLASAQWKKNYNKKYKIEK